MKNVEKNVLFFVSRENRVECLSIFNEVYFFSLKIGKVSKENCIMFGRGEKSFLLNHFE